MSSDDTGFGRGRGRMRGNDRRAVKRSLVDDPALDCSHYEGRLHDHCVIGSVRRRRAMSQEETPLDEGSLCQDMGGDTKALESVEAEKVQHAIEDVDPIRHGMEDVDLGHHGMEDNIDSFVRRLENNSELMEDIGSIVDIGSLEATSIAQRLFDCDALFESDVEWEIEAGHGVREVVQHEQSQSSTSESKESNSSYSGTEQSLSDFSTNDEVDVCIDMDERDLSYMWHQ